MKKRGGINQHYICQGCKESFGSERIPRLLPICGHTLCENCIERLMEDTQGGKVVLKCVVDGKVMEFQGRELSNFPKNFAMLKTIEKRQAMVAATKPEQQPIPVSQKVEELQDTKSQQSDPNLIPQSKQENPSNTVQQGDSVAEESKLAQKEQSIEQGRKSIIMQEMCLIHSRPLEIVCLKDSVMICSNCALFGQHRNHDVKSLGDIKKDVILKEQEFLEVIDQKDQIQNQLFKSIGQEQIVKLVNNKKQSLESQIQQHFDKLSKRLRQQEKKLYQNLEQIIKSVEKGFREDSDKATAKFSEFRDWERTALDYINILEGDCLQKKLSILDYQSSKSKIDPIEEGYRIIDNTIKLKSDILSDWETLLSNFQIDFQPEKTQAFIASLTINPPARDKKEEFLTESLKKITLKEKEKSRELDPLTYSSPERLKNLSTNDDLLLEMEHHIPNHYTIPHLEFDSSINMEYYMGEIPDISKIQYKDSSFNVQTTPFEYKPQVPKSPSAISNRTYEPKKKPKPVKVPPKYEKMMEGLMSDGLDVLDFTNSELGNQDMSCVLEHLKGKKVKTVKLIRCKLSDDILNQLWNSMSKVISLNLSQNTFTDRVIDSFIDNIHKMPHLRTLTLSQNKINQRNVKNRIQQARKMEVTISI